MPKTFGRMSEGNGCTTKTIFIEAVSSAQPEITDEQAIEHLRSTGWMQNHDREMYDLGLKEQLADDSGSYDSLLPTAQPYTDEQIQKMQELEQAEIENAFQLGREDALSEIVRCKDCRWGKEACGNIECFADINVPSEYHGYEWFCPNGEGREDATF